MAQTKQAAEAATLDAMQAEIAALKAALAAKSAPQSLTLRPSKKGGLSLYGMGRWPVTLYPSQWEALLGKAEDVRKALAVGTELGLLATDKANAIERDDAAQAEALKAFAAAMAAKS